jgi:hypothetical protein
MGLADAGSIAHLLLVSDPVYIRCYRIRSPLCSGPTQLPSNLC